MTELKDVVNKEVAPVYNFFAGGQINLIKYNYVIYSRYEYVKGIHPVCRLKRKAPRGGANNPSQQAARKQLMATYDAILRNATSTYNAIQKFKNLTSAGYAVSWPDFERKLRERFPEPILSFNNVKREMSSKKFKYERQAIYSRVYKDFQSNQRKILAHYRDTGVWVNSVLKKKPAPVPVANSPRTARRKNFNNYWSKLTKENRNVVRNYIETHKSPKAASPGTPSLRANINKLKTAKARAEWLKAKKPNLSAEEFAKAKNYVRTKNTAARAARKALKK
jgi:hypothetical protein